MPAAVLHPMFCGREYKGDALRISLAEYVRSERRYLYLSATVVGAEFYAFPNGAVTGVLLLAQSHLSVPTWPELGLANVDLLSCGDIDGTTVLDTIRARLDVERASVRCIHRSLG